MKLSRLPVAEMIAALRSTNPTPGGGSASALAGSAGAALLAMVGAMPKIRASGSDESQRLQLAASRCGVLSETLLDLMDRDSDAYDAVVAAYRLPKTSDAEKAARKSAIQAAMKTAAETPLETMRHVAEAQELSPVVAQFGNPQAASDVEVALELLRAAQRGAKANVEINLASIDDAGFVERLRAEVAGLDQRSAAASAAAREAMRQQG
jgi:formiminotetrahydrofolate cyclodeaminase